MALWRAAAIKHLPELRDLIAKSPNVMSLWIELKFHFERAYREPRNDDLIRRVYAFAIWCEKAERNDDPSRDPFSAVVTAFYEHIPDLHAAREDMARWFTKQEIEQNRVIFAYHIGEEAFNNLLVHIQRNANRYIGRDLSNQ